MREQIERALGEFLWAEPGNTICGFDALAEQAIVAPIRVRHIVSGQIGRPERTVEITKISLGYEHPERGWIDMPTKEIGGHHGTPGKALAIIVPLEEVDGE